jgi:tetratricopeptide (TPR) repeat protein
VNANPYGVSKTSGFAQCHYRLGIIARQAGRVDEAASEYAKAIELDPEYAPSRVNLAEIQIVRGDRAGAVAQLREAVRIDPEYGKARYNLGLALAWMGEWVDAGREFDEGRRLAPGSPDSWFGTGAFRFRFGDWIGAQLMWETMRDRAAAANAPAVVARANDLLRLLARQRAIEAAAGEGDTVVRQNARTAAFWAVAGERARAEVIIRSISRPASDAVHLYQEGDLLVAAGRLAPGEALLRDALAIRPGLPFAHFSLGAARLLASDPEGAAREFAAEVAVNPQNAEAHFNLGVLALEYRNDREAAARHLRDCIAQGGSKAEDARALLARIERS